jgi:hypothetical protein
MNEQYTPYLLTMDAFLALFSLLLHFSVASSFHRGFIFTTLNIFFPAFCPFWRQMWHFDAGSAPYGPAWLAHADALASVSPQ